MADTPETKAKKQIKATIANVCRDLSVSAKLVWSGGGLVGAATLDCVGVIGGVPVVIEVKRFDRKCRVTARQQMDVREFREAGALAWVIDSSHALQAFESALRTSIIQNVTVAALRAGINPP